MPYPLHDKLLQHMVQQTPFALSPNFNSFWPDAINIYSTDHLFNQDS